MVELAFEVHARFIFAAEDSFAKLAEPPRHRDIPFGSVLPFLRVSRIA
jgi:hypothetical protein